MKIGIFGLGYVGLTTGACLLRKGFEVIGYEISDAKRQQLAGGRVPLSEPGVEATVLSGLSDGRFRVSGKVETDDVPDVFFISVGTPSDERGGTNLTAVDGVLAQLDSVRGALMEQTSEIVLRSTVPPGTLGAFSQKFPELFSKIPVGFYPEFLREGTAISDFENPPQTVYGTLPGRVKPRKIVEIFERFGFDYDMVDAVSAESLKFACNAYHALKVCFANEMGRLVSSFGGDAEEVMRLFVRDRQLNVSAKYLMPGAPFGGSCLPKDTRSVRNLSVCRGLDLRMITSCEESNQAHFSFVVDRIKQLAPKRLAILGLSFKRDTDDIRESPSVEILYRLASTGGIELAVHDYLVRPETVVGVNQKLLEKLVMMPSIEFSDDIEEILSHADAVIIMHVDPRYEEAVENINIPVLNVARWKGLQTVTSFSHLSDQDEGLEIPSVSQERAV